MTLRLLGTIFLGNVTSIWHKLFSWFAKWFERTGFIVLELKLFKTKMLNFKVSFLDKNGEKPA